MPDRPDQQKAADRRNDAGDAQEMIRRPQHVLHRMLDPGGQPRDQLDKEAESYGIDVVDVRTRRVDLPEQNSQAVYQRMQTERQREAAEFRAQGAQKAQEIRSNADRQATVIIADANSKAEQTRGDGDGERNRVFADAYGRDPDFFAFYRAMSAYESALRSNDTRYLLKPDSDFFRFFGDPSGKPREPAPARPQ